MADRVTATDSGGSKFLPHPAGSFGMRCVDVVDLGAAVQSYAGETPYLTHKCALVFASGERHENGDLVLVTQEYTVSMNERAKLRQHLEAWRGKAYTDEQAKQGVPVDKLEGQPALVVVSHRQSKKGRTYATIDALGPLPKGMVVEDLSADYARPEFFKDRQKANADAVAKFRADLGQSHDEAPAHDDSDIPF
jgi:hypothetical protein